MLTPDQWSHLLAIPAPAALPKPSALSRAQAEQALWAAVDAGDVDSARRAISAGARLSKRRKGRSVLWQAVHLDQWEMVEFLVASGANLNEIHGHRRLLTALVVRDDHTQADRLVALGMDDARVTPRDFFYEQGAPALLEWWIARGRLDKETFKKVKNEEWLKIGVAGSSRLRTMLNDFWGHDATDPNAFSGLPNISPYGLTRLWETVLNKDDPAQVKALLKSGWGFPAPTTYETLPSWLPAQCGAWEVVSWLCQSEAFAAKMRTDAQTHPSLTWWPAASSRRAIERIKLLGVDIEAVDASGATLAHHLCAGRLGSRELPVSTIAWLQQFYPGMFQVVSNAGHRPLDLLENHETALIQAHALSRATPVETSAPRRTVSRL